MEISHQLILGIIIGMGLLLALILYFRIHAFLALLISSIVTGLISGLDAEQVMQTVITGMGSTLGYVATVVGLGAIFGGILEQSGGARAISRYLLEKMGIDRAPWAMVLTGFIVAIPVFFDVAFIILVPVIYALQKSTKKSLLIFAIPLLAGLATTHAFIPPTPGPVAVADLIGANLGWVIVFGFLVGVPTVLLSGILFGDYIGKRIHLPAMDFSEGTSETKLPSVHLLFGIIGIPIVLILVKTLINSQILVVDQGSIFHQLIILFGHPIVALIIANLLAWYLLGLRGGFSRVQLSDISKKSLQPAGTIILLTGAGGVFKQVLVDTEIGKLVAENLLALGMPVIFFAFFSAAIVRLLQGSATVSMITAAGMVAAISDGSPLSEFQLALLVIVIAAGASTTSHVNDSGFWLVSQYLGMDEKQTFRSWTMMTTILALSGFIFSLILWQFF